MKVASRSFVNVVKFKYLGTSLTNKKCLTSITRDSKAGVLHRGLPGF
jgi:hypothetical protein